MTIQKLVVLLPRETIKTLNIMKNTILNYKRNGVDSKLNIDPKLFSKLVREKVKHEYFAEYEAVMVIVMQFISDLYETPDEFTFEFTDDEGYIHTFFGNFKK